ncbi:quinone-dependent dihydroorotate dehydrogenase [Paracoccaceae bacterium]|nr:quinone-dependent dihydroorotate dehydrogenase [Paracoccaceae bacterium]
MNHYFGAKILHRIEPEISHAVAICYLRLLNRLVKKKKSNTSALKTKISGMELPSPIGLAAGFDKNAEVFNASLSLGFGFVEVGTITPDPQAGNPKPRLFRLPDEGALINKMGFNNKGMLYVSRTARMPKLGIVGVNIGANAKSINKVLDYTIIFEFLAHLFDYVTINVSSPNTKNLRDLQKPEVLEKILKNVNAINVSLKRQVPIFIKIAPDLNENNVTEILNVCEENNVSGLIATNTTISPKALKKPKIFTGGLSGKPLFKPSNKILKLLAKRKDPSTALIGVGGIFSASDVYEKIRLGASAVQIYSGFVYNGPKHIKKMEVELENLLLKDGYSSIERAVGASIR